jgi:hypothetical protein
MLGEGNVGIRISVGFDLEGNIPWEIQNSEKSCSKVSIHGINGERKTLM